MSTKCHGRESDNMVRHYAGNARKFAACGRDGQLQRCVIKILMLLGTQIWMVLAGLSRKLGALEQANFEFGGSATMIRNLEPTG